VHIPGFRTPIGRLVRLPLRLIPKSLVLPVLSGGNRGAQWITGSLTHGAWLGIYERDKQDAMIRLIRPGMTVVDAGAHAGFYSLLMSRLVGPRGRVFAFEPFPDNARNLIKHVKINGLTNVTIVPAGLWRRNGLMPFAAGEHTSMGRVGERGGSLAVPVYALDELVKSFMPPPNLVKVDVEGAEANVLHGARGLMSRRPPVWLIATHGHQQFRTCVSTLRRHSYRIIDLMGVDIAAKRKQIDEIVAITTGPRGRQHVCGRGRC
jgi:FkbM family methyltransferase